MTRHLRALPGRGHLAPVAIRGDDGRTQDGTPGNPATTDRFRTALKAVTGPTSTCGHPGANITVTSPTGGRRLVCHQCVLDAAERADGISYLDPDGGCA